MKISKKIAKIVAYSVAGVIMIGALGYYNFIDKAPESGVEKGNRCPDFTAQTYAVDGDTFYVDGEFTLSQQIGKVVVVNFWETWCQACVQELPEFNEIQVKYAEQVEVIAIAGVTSTVDEAATWMSEKGWHVFDEAHDWVDFSLTFGYLPTQICTDLGCGGMLPRTIIVDKSGIVAFEVDGSMTYESLEQEIEKLL